MPSTLKEWLPKGMSDGGSSQPAEVKVTVVGRMQSNMSNFASAGREQAATMQNAAAAAGMPVAPAEKSAFDSCCKLTYAQRFKYFLYCIVAGICISVLSFVMWWITHCIPCWAFLYVSGNIVSLLGTGYARALHATAHHGVARLVFAGSRNKFSRVCVRVICSFLLGFRRQLRNMSAAKRRISVAVYISMLLLTLILAFAGAPSIIIILCVFVTVR